ncbi:NADPH-dependent FMN reductase [Pseudovibrio sp. Tun.PSC04-5.I4]|uniref:NADPH-dependent FMN reductase n=1 Tax=Pseudovibrio sp. Tun.PSC04-5.I4 TaxID=1798213 RepID=UPI00087DF981|nr:NADPH-dependent FMN reductase [Pseudovibrio sp. Tun.PSC04-5.I4]SDR48622.1 NAD(P)H-dependent FMN reductase [Pseudovibrio sp. Tun.PSC04-5.I4]
MKILAISGSARGASTNTALLNALPSVGSPDHEIIVFQGVSDLPVFSPDLEAHPLPEKVQLFTKLIQEADGIIISSPEYVRAIPGGLKNAIDWLVSRDELIAKPIALMHASHRGDDMLKQLRLVLSTVSERFSEDIFLKFELMKHTPLEISEILELPENKISLVNYLREFSEYCGASQPLAAE